MGQETLRTPISEKVKNLPHDSLSLLGLSSKELLLAINLGHIPLTASYKQSRFNPTAHNPIMTSLLETMGYANKHARKDGSTPMIALAIATHNQIEMDRVISSFDIEGSTLNKTQEEIEGILEDKFPRIEYLIRRFAESQQPLKAQG